MNGLSWPPRTERLPAIGGAISGALEYVTIEYLGIGIHLYPAKESRRWRNRVTTLMPPISAKRLTARFKRQRHYRPEKVPDDPPSVGQ